MSSAEEEEEEEESPQPLLKRLKKHNNNNNKYEKSKKEFLTEHGIEENSEENENNPRWKAPKGMKLLVGSVGRVITNFGNGMYRVIFYREKWSDTMNAGWSSARRKKSARSAINEIGRQERIEAEIEKRIENGDTMEQIMKDKVEINSAAADATAEDDENTGLEITGRFGSVSGLIRYVLWVDENNNRVKSILRAKVLFQSNTLTLEDVKHRVEKLKVFETGEMRSQLSEPLKRAGITKPTSHITDKSIKHVDRAAALNFFDNIFLLHNNEILILLCCFFGSSTILSKIVYNKLTLDELIKNPFIPCFFRESPFIADSIKKLANTLYVPAKILKQQKLLIFLKNNTELYAQAYRVFRNILSSLMNFGNSLTKIQNSEVAELLINQLSTSTNLVRIKFDTENYLMFKNNLEIEQKLTERINKLNSSSFITILSQNDDDDDDHNNITSICESIERNALSFLNCNANCDVKKLVFKMMDRHPSDFLVVTTYLSDPSGGIMSLYKYLSLNVNEDDDDDLSEQTTNNVENVRFLIVLGAEELGILILNKIFDVFTSLKQLCLIGDSRIRPPFANRTAIKNEYGTPFFNIVKSDNLSFFKQEISELLPSAANKIYEDVFIKKNYQTENVSIKPLTSIVSFINGAGDFRCFANNRKQCDDVMFQRAKKSRTTFRINDVVTVVNRTSTDVSGVIKSFEIQRNYKKRKRTVAEWKIYDAEAEAEQHQQEQNKKEFSFPISYNQCLILKIEDLENPFSVTTITTFFSESTRIIHSSCITVRSRPTFCSRRVSKCGLLIGPTTTWHDIYTAVSCAKEKLIFFTTTEEGENTIHSACRKYSAGSFTLFKELIVKI